METIDIPSLVVEGTPERITPRNPYALTPREEAFARAWVANGGDYALAYRAAGYAPLREKSMETRKGKEMMQKPRVRQRINQIREAAAQRNDVTVDYVIHKLKMIVEGAMEVKDYRAAHSSLVTLAEYLKMIGVKGEGTTINLGFISADVMADARRLATVLNLPAPPGT